MVNKNKELAVNTAILTIGRICTQFMSFFLMPLYTAALSTEEYGVVDLVGTYTSLLLPVALLQIDQTSAYFWSFQSTVFSLWHFQFPEGSRMRSPFSSRSYTLRAFGSHLPCSSIARSVSRMWACGFPSSLSWMAKSAIIPLETNCS